MAPLDGDPMRTTLACLATTALLASGCAVAPHGQGCRSVTHDVVDYFDREWPLAGAPAPSAACGDYRADDGVVYIDDWDQPGCHPHAYGWTDDPPPAVPLEPGPPGRFFPVPVKPAFSPQGPSPVGILPIRAAEETGV